MNSQVDDRVPVLIVGGSQMAANPGIKDFTRGRTDGDGISAHLDATTSCG